MPMVPMFQQGLPTVQQSGGSGAMTVSMPTPDMSYQKTMAVAARPVAEFAGSLQKMAETQFARDVKALSDEAEMQAMQVINTALYDPENGYLTKKGKDAPDAYKGTLEGLKKDLGDITSKLPVPVREAVQSRINERGLNAESTMQRWNAQQTGQWHMESSIARQKFLEDEYALHYSDPEYRARTWASIQEEIAYQGSKAGLSTESIEQARRDTWNRIETGRLGAMSQDNPVAAFAELHRLKGKISSDAYAKADSALWAASKNELALEVSQRFKVGSREELARAALDRNAKTGIPLVDGLRPARKAEVLSMALAFQDREKTEGRVKLKRDVDNSYAQAANDESPEPISRERFVEALGEKEGGVAHDEYMSGFAMRENVARFQTMTSEDILGVVNAMKPQRGSPNYAEENRNYQAALKGATEVTKARTEDPVGMATRSGTYGFTPITDWSSQGIAHEMTNRVAMARQLAKDYGSTPALLSENEATQLSEAIAVMPTDQRIRTLEQLAGICGEKGSVQILANQLGSKNQEFSTALFLMSGGNMSLGSKYLIGKDALAQKRVPTPPTGEGSIGSFYDVIGEGKGAAAFSQNPQVLSRIVDAARGVWAAGQATGEVISVEQALKQVLGGEIIEWNNRKIVTPGNPYKPGSGYVKSSWLGMDFSGLVKRRAEQMSKEKGEVIVAQGRVSLKNFSALLPKAQLESVDDGKYRIIDPRWGYVLNPDGTPYVLSVLP